MYEHVLPKMEHAYQICNIHLTEIETRGFRQSWSSAQVSFEAYKSSLESFKLILILNSDNLLLFTAQKGKRNQMSP